MKKTFQFEVAGVSHRLPDYVKANVGRGDPLMLKPEPTNPYDVHAIAVYAGDIQIGYVPRTHNQLIKGAVNEGRVRCLVNVVWPRGCWAWAEAYESLQEMQAAQAVKQGTPAEDEHERE
jgi:hypothetical protein